MPEFQDTMPNPRLYLVNGCSSDYRFLPVNSTIASFGEFKEDTVNASVFGGNNPEAVRICDRAGWQ